MQAIVQIKSFTHGYATELVVKKRYRKQLAKLMTYSTACFAMKLSRANLKMLFFLLGRSCYLHSTLSFLVVETVFLLRWKKTSKQAPEGRRRETKAVIIKGIVECVSLEYSIWNNCSIPGLFCFKR